MTAFIIVAVVIIVAFFGYLAGGRSTQRKIDVRLRAERAIAEDRLKKLTERK